MSRSLWIAALGLAGLCVVWFFNEFERVPDKEWVPPKPEVRLRPYLAAERFAQRMGLQAKELRAIPELKDLPPRGLLLLPRLRQELDPATLASLLAWVGAGGHLVVEAEAIGQSDALLDLLGFKRKALASRKIAEVTLSDGRKLKALLPGPAVAAPVREPLVAAGEGDAWRLVSFRRARGVVTVASSLAFAGNELADQHDHAQLLWALMQAGPATELDVFARPRKLSLLGFLGEHAAPALAGGVLLLALWLWRVAPRFGPLVPDAPPARRRLLDHLRASGRYLWARGQRERLLAAAREAALRRLARAQPEFAAATDAERAARLARLAGVSERDAAHFLAAQAPGQAAMPGAVFIDMVRVAQQVHAALDKGKG
jgi:hypothetical protein